MSNKPEIWRPFSPLVPGQTPLRVLRGEGSWLHLDNGKKIFDGISSWWVNIHGHANTHIAKAISNQAYQLEHVIFAGFTHDPAEKLAEELVRILPISLNKVFFSDNGSTAVEVALKMSFQYWKNLGINNKTRFIVFDGGYHGDTFGAMSVGARTPFNLLFDDILFEADSIPYPETWIGSDDTEERENEIISTLEVLIEQHKGIHAACIIEPLIQGAGGMRMCSSEFLQKLEKVLKKNGVLLIYDEVMTGFGRTGAYFACTESSTSPDIICLSKGLTGGFLPMAVTVTSEQVMNTFRSDNPEHTFWHGHSYTANPLGCAAALASMELLKVSDEARNAIHAVHMQQIRFLTNVRKPRIRGTIAAFDFITHEESGYFNTASTVLKKAFLEQNLLLRPLGNTVYIMPPYSTTPDELEWVYEVVGNVFRQLQVPKHL